MHKPSHVEVSGPLAAYAVGFRQELAGRGYSRSRATGLLLLMARLSRRLAGLGRASTIDNYRRVAVRFLAMESDQRGHFTGPKAQPCQHGEDRQMPIAATAHPRATPG